MQLHATTVTGTNVEITGAFALNTAGTVTGLASEALTVSDAVTTANANALNGLTDQAVTATISDGDMATLAALTETGHAYTVTVTDASANALALTQLDGKTTVQVTVNSTAITGTETQIRNAVAAAGLSDLSAKNLTIDSGAIADDDVATFLALTTGTVTATIAADTYTNLSAASCITETGHALALDITAGGTLPTAAQLNSLRAKTTGVVNIQQGTITGFVSELAELYEAQTAGTVTGLAAETLTISDTGTVNAADLNTINDGTSIAVAAAGITGLTGTATAINTAYTSNTAGSITGLGNEALTITGDATAAALTTANTNTTGLVTVNSTAITGTYDQVIALYAANNGTTLTGLGNEAITVSDTSLTVTQANAVDALTTGAVTATISANDVDTLATLTGTGNAYAITVTDTSVSAANINALNAKTTVAVNVLSTAVSGTSTELITSYAAQGTGVSWFRKRNSNSYWRTWHHCHSERSWISWYL